MIKKNLLLIIILLLGFVFRLYRFTEPVADWHSFRQSDTQAVSQIFVDEGYNLLYPKYYDISNVQSGLDNPEGYRLVEFPLYNFLQAFFYKFFGILTLTEWGRLLNIIASLATALVIFSLLKKYLNKFSAYVGLGAYLFLPFSVFYSRVVLPDVMMTTSIMLGIYFFDRYLDLKKSREKLVSFSFSALFVAVAFLLKPFSLFFILPLVYLAYKKFGIKMFTVWQFYVFAFISIVPIILWRVWISQFPEGIPASEWLFNGNGIRYRPAFLRWMIYERLAKLILGYFGTILLFFSLLSIKQKKIHLFLSFAISTFIYVFVIATGNVQHDYYQIPIVPTICFFLGIGSYNLFRLLKKRLGIKIAAFCIVIIAALSLFFSWMQIRDYFNINDRGMVKAAEKANEVLPKDAIIIAPYDGSTTLLNLSRRRGWPIFQQSIEELIDKGAEYMVIANPTENDFSGFGTEFEVLTSSEEYLILKLK